MLLSCGASPVGPDDDITFEAIIFMYIVVLEEAAIPLGRFNHAIVEVAVFTAFDSTQAWIIVPGVPAAAFPVVNSTFDHPEFM